jgi:hypothetical protein
MPGANDVAGDAADAAAALLLVTLPEGVIGDAMGATAPVTAEAEVEADPRALRFVPASLVAA